MSDAEDRPEVVVLYGPNANATSHWLAKASTQYSILGVAGSPNSTPPPGLAWFGTADDLTEELKRITSANPSLRIGFLGAAFPTQSALLVQETTQSIRAQLDGGVQQYVNLTRALLPHMMRARFGRFIYISSFRSASPTPGTTLYSASKAFGETFFRSVGIEYGRMGITAVSIRLGYIEGGMLSGFDDEKLHSVRKKVGLRRLGTPSDVAEAVDFCLSNPYANGGVLELTGGLDG